MSIKITIIIVVCMVLSIIYFFSLVSKNKLGYKYAFFWAILAIIVSVMALWPQSLKILASAMGVAVPINALFYLGFMFLLILVFSLSISISSLSDKVRRLTQDIAILRKESHDGQREIRAQIDELENKD